MTLNSLYGLFIRLLVLHTFLRGSCLTNTVVLGEAANRVPKGVMVLTRKGVSAGRSRAAGCELCSVIVASKMRKTVQGTAVRV